MTALVKPPRWIRQVPLAGRPNGNPSSSIPPGFTRRPVIVAVNVAGPLFGAACLIAAFVTSSDPVFSRPLPLKT